MTEHYVVVQTPGWVRLTEPMPFDDARNTCWLLQFLGHHCIPVRLGRYKDVAARHLTEAAK